MKITRVEPDGRTSSFLADNTLAVRHANETAMFVGNFSDFDQFMHLMDPVGKSVWSFSKETPDEMIHRANDMIKEANKILEQYKVD